MGSRARDPNLHSYIADADDLMDDQFMVAAYLSTDESLADLG